MRTLSPGEARPEFKPGARTGMIVGQRDGAAMPPRHRAHEAQTEPVARGAAARLEPDEAVEHALAIGLGNARSMVGHLDHRATAVAVRRRPRPRRRPAIFQRVVQQIRDRLRQQMAVALGSSSPGTLSNRSTNAVLLGERFVQLDRGADDLGQIEPLAAPPAGAGLGLGDAQQRIEGRQQPVGLVDRGADRVALGGAVLGPRSASSSRARSRASGVFRSCATLSVTSRMPVISRSIWSSMPLRLAASWSNSSSVPAAAPGPTDCRP